MNHSYDDDGIRSPIDLSVDAALELEEYKRNLRSDVPALNALFRFIRTPSPAYGGKSVSLLADVRAYPLLRDSLGDHSKKRPANFEEFKTWVESYLADLETGVAKRVEKKIEEAKRFCLSLNTHLLARQMNELYARRERPDSRSFDHESLL
jgi:hypothetical protein